MDMCRGRIVDIRERDVEPKDPLSGKIRGRSSRTCRGAGVTEEDGRGRVSWRQVIH